MNYTKAGADAPGTSEAPQNRRGRRLAAREAAKPPTRYLTLPEAAKVAGVSGRSLERLRAAGEGPPIIKIGAAVRYPERELHAWLEAKITGKAAVS